MTITSVRLQNYRSYRDSSFEFDGGVNIVVGPNASGKTNLIDSLYFIATGQPIRSGSEHIINYQMQWARVDGLTSLNQQRILKIKQDQKSELIIDGKSYRRPPLKVRLPVVLFEPNHLYFITSSPDMRRQLIDDILSKTDSEFTGIKNTYTRVLRQRNNLLKQSPINIKDQMFVWDVRLSELAGQYVSKRLQLIKVINAKASQVYSSIAGKPHNLQLSHESKITTKDYANGMMKWLQKNIEIDQLRGFTGAGPHRDDISIVIDGKDMRDVASRGETRSILLSLKIIEAELVNEFYDQKPLLLLDDVFGELDGSRRKSLISFISNYQAFITTTDADIIAHHFTKDSKIITTLNN